MIKIRYFLLVLALQPWQAVADSPVLRQGVWPGTIKLAGKDAASARVLVSNETNDSDKVHTRVVMYVDDIPLEFIDLKIRKNSLRFKIDTGITNSCTLERMENGSYAGFCTSSGAATQDERIELTMRPPREEDESKPISASTGETSE